MSSSLESKKEFDWDDYILQDDDIQCSICDGIYEKGTFEPTPGFKKKGSQKSYSRYDICHDCQGKKHPCINNCGTYLSITTFINGHNPRLCRIAYVKSHPHTEKDAKIAELEKKLTELQIQLKKTNISLNVSRRKAEYLEKKNENFNEKFNEKFEILQKMKTYIEYDLQPRLLQMSLSTCTDCRVCKQHTIDKHTCSDCERCVNCKNTVTLQNYKKCI